MSQGKTPLWLDCDPGHDDVFAIILAAEHPSLEIVGISTVHGNSSLDKVTRNAVRVLTAIGRTDIPVYAGSGKPFLRPAVHAPAIHGESGIDGTNLLPESKISHCRGNAILAMYQTIMKTPLQTCVIVATGPLTNVALLLATFPDVVGHIKGVSIMGGSFEAGNITPHAEFNIYCDPEAANSIFSNASLSNRLTLIPLDLTHQVLGVPPILERLLIPTDRPMDAASKKTTPLRKMLHDLITFFAHRYATVFNITEGPPLHDPLAVAAVIPPSSPSRIPGWKWVHKKVTVDVTGVTLGRTVMHEPNSSSSVTSAKEGNEEISHEETDSSFLGHRNENSETIVRIGMGVDVEAFWNVMLKAVDIADSRGAVTWKDG